MAGWARKNCQCLHCGFVAKVSLCQYTNIYYHIRHSIQSIQKYTIDKIKQTYHHILYTHLDSIILRSSQVLETVSIVVTFCPAPGSRTPASFRSALWTARAAKVAGSVPTAWQRVACRNIVVAYIDSPLRVPTNFIKFLICTLWKYKYNYNQMILWTRVRVGIAQTLEWWQEWLGMTGKGTMEESWRERIIPKHSEYLCLH